MSTFGTIICLLGTAAAIWLAFTTSIDVSMVAYFALGSGGGAAFFFSLISIGLRPPPSETGTLVLRVS